MGTKEIKFESMDGERCNFDLESYERTTFETLKGQKILAIKIPNKINDFIRIQTEEYIYFVLHQEDCCEDVYLESITEGYEEALINQVVLVAEEATNANERIYKRGVIVEERTNKNERTYGTEGETYTFYKLITKEGFVDIRFCGSSNGYYSESVDIYRKSVKEATIDDIINPAKDVDINALTAALINDPRTIEMFKLMGKVFEERKQQTDK